MAATDQRADIATRWGIWRTEKDRRVADDRGRWSVYLTDPVRLEQMLAG